MKSIFKQNKTPLFFKTLNVTKDKDKLKMYSKLKDTEETWQFNAQWLDPEL
jgi:hypothetical protein